MGTIFRAQIVLAVSIALVESSHLPHARLDVADLRKDNVFAPTTVEDPAVKILPIMMTDGEGRENGPVEALDLSPSKETVVNTQTTTMQDGVGGTITVTRRTTTTTVTTVTRTTTKRRRKRKTAIRKTRTDIKNYTKRPEMRPVGDRLDVNKHDLLEDDPSVYVVPETVTAGEQKPPMEEKSEKLLLIEEPDDYAWVVANSPKRKPDGDIHNDEEEIQFVPIVVIRSTYENGALVHRNFLLQEGDELREISEQELPNGLTTEQMAKDETRIIHEDGLGAEKSFGIELKYQGDTFFDKVISLP